MGPAGEGRLGSVLTWVILYNLGHGGSSGRREVGLCIDMGHSV